MEIRTTLADWMTHGPKIVLAAAEPQVTLSGHYPSHVVGGTHYGWYRGGAVNGVGSTVPDDVWQLLDGGERTDSAVYYDGWWAALGGMSRALVAWAKQKAKEDAEAKAKTTEPAADRTITIGGVLGEQLHLDPVTYHVTGTLRAWMKYGPALVRCWSVGRVELTDRNPTRVVIAGNMTSPHYWIWNHTPEGEIPAQLLPAESCKLHGSDQEARDLLSSCLLGWARALSMQLPQKATPARKKPKIDRATLKQAEERLMVILSGYEYRLGIGYNPSTRDPNGVHPDDPGYTLRVVMDHLPCRNDTEIPDEILGVPVLVELQKISWRDQ